MPVSHSGKVAKACERCRKQKLKCDVSRPCMLCVRSNAQCISVERDVWRTQKRHRSRSNETSLVVDGSRPFTPHRGGQELQHSDTLKSSGPPDENIPSSSAAVTFVKEAFQQHGSIDNSEEVSSLNTGGTRKRLSNTQVQLVAKFRELLPQFEPASILVESYFDRIHWFILIFHQEDFRQKFVTLYRNMDSQISYPRIDDLGFMSLLLAVFAISLTYAGEQRTDTLIVSGIDVEQLKDDILVALRAGLIDIVALGSLESVQTCILLGSYHLNQGEPELAWPICGCAIRIAQALHLHRSSTTISTTSERANSSRRRCWWALYEVETFCCMLYGLPPGVSDADCDVEMMDIRDSFSCAVWREEEQDCTLLSYKTALSTMSLIIRGALQDLYGRKREPTVREPFIRRDKVPRKNLVEKVKNLNFEVQKWYENLPGKLKREAIQSTQDQVQSPISYQSTSMQDKAFETYLFQLQAITLQFAFHSTKILIHRPLLSYKADQTKKPSDNRSTNHSIDPIKASIKSCREAALAISDLVSNPVFKEASNTFAVALVCVHLLTAGITLCIMTSLEPMSPESHQCKLGIRRIIEALTRLTPKSIVAGQGLEVMKRLVALVLKKELEKMVNFDDSTTDDHTGEDVTLLVEDTIDPLAREEPDIPSSLQSGPSVLNAFPVDPLVSEYGFILSEDPGMEQALFEFGLAMNGHVSSQEEQESRDSFEEFFNDCFVSQDQNWLWGPYEPM